MQERRNSSALAMELRFSYTKTIKWNTGSCLAVIQFLEPKTRNNFFHVTQQHTITQPENPLLVQRQPMT